MRSMVVALCGAIAAAAPTTRAAVGENAKRAVAEETKPKPEPLPTPNDRFPPKSWSAAGWTTLSWGMGFGDVLAALRDPKGPFRVAEQFRCDDSPGGPGLSRSRVSPDLAECWLEPESHSLELVGERPRIALSFWKRRLCGVMLFLRGGVDLQEHARRHFTLLGILNEKYGRAPQVFPEGYSYPTEVPEDPSVSIYSWGLQWLEVQFTSVVGRGPRSNTLGNFTINYADPRAMMELNSQGRSRRFESDRDKL